MSSASAYSQATHPVLLAERAGQFLAERLGKPDVAVIVGSGWAAAAAGIGDTVAELQLVDVPGGKAPSVQGHSGQVRAIDLHGRRVWLCGGRTHLYEGNGPHEVVHVARSCVLAGAATVILTNAAGGMNAAVAPGTPVMIADQLNLTGTSPMLGPHPPDGFPGRFCDVSEIYSTRLRAAAAAHDLTITEGVYAGVLGGAYETPAEIQMLRGFGASLVGMSTVLEAIAARHLGAEVAGVSLVTNLAAGMQAELSHQEVLDVAESSADRVLSLIDALIAAA